MYPEGPWPGGGKGRDNGNATEGGDSHQCVHVGANKPEPQRMQTVSAFFVESFFGDRKLPTSCRGSRLEERNEWLLCWEYRASFPAVYPIGISEVEVLASVDQIDLLPISSRLP
jgi:hypothetical protein